MKVMPLVYVILLFIALCSTANAESLPVAMPDNLNWSYQPMNVYLNFNPSNLTDTSFTASLNISNYKVIGSNKTYYVNVNTGSDTNNGLTPGAALGTIAAAVAKSDVDIIVLAPGTYTRDPTSNGLGNVVQLNITRNVSIVCPDGRAKVSLRNAFATWTQNGTYTNVYEVSRSGIYRVFDSSKLDGYGDYTELKHVNSVAEVNTNVSSWYNDGVKTYVRTSDGHVPGTEMCLYLGTGDLYPIKSISGKSAYLENIDFEGGISGIYADYNSTIYAKNCSVKYSVQSNGISMLGSNGIFVNCVTAKNCLDGFNYHQSAATGKSCYGIEINCIGRDNGAAWINSSPSDNGSTSHERCCVIRLNGNYMRNYGPNVADVTGAHSWNINCTAYDSATVGSIAENASFYIRDAHTDGARAMIWLDSCTAYGSYRDLYKGANCDVYNTSSNVIIHFNPILYPVAEQASDVEITIDLSKPTNANNITVAISTADSTAKSATDYTAISETVVFEPGETTKTVTIPLVAKIGDERTFYVNITDPVGATLYSDNATITIAKAAAYKVTLIATSHTELTSMNEDASNVTLEAVSSSGMGALYDSVMDSINSGYTLVSLIILALGAAALMRYMGYM